MRIVPCMVILTALAGCGALPQPFVGNPGATGRRLAQPPPARLAIPPSTSALLTDEGGAALAQELTAALVDQEVPAVSEPARKGDWRLATSAELQNGQVTPTYSIIDPSGVAEGAAQGKPVDAAAWSEAKTATLHDAAVAAAPSIASLLSGIDAARRQSDPNSLLNRPPRIAVIGVTGAPGDGNVALAREMRRELPKLGEIVQDDVKGSDFTVVGDVKAAPGAGGTTRIEVQWIVNDDAGKERGRIVQLNEVPPGTLDKFWGDVAVVVAEQAAGGVKDVILNLNVTKKP